MPGRGRGRPDDSAMPNDPQFGEQWALCNVLIEYNTIMSFSCV